jgi:hypothetical protein
MSKQAEVIPAKKCYSHIGGKLGMLLMESFIDKGWLSKTNPDDDHFHITNKGKKEFTKLGIDLSQIKQEKIKQ